VAVSAEGTVGEDHDRNCASLLESVATSLTQRSHAIGDNPTAVTPFATAAKKAGENWDGGKMDDVVVVLGLVVADEKAIA
jgi:hypothetical protein